MSDPNQPDEPETPDEGGTPEPPKDEPGQDGAEGGAEGGADSAADGAPEAQEQAEDAAAPSAADPASAPVDAPDAPRIEGDAPDAETAGETDAPAAISGEPEPEPELEPEPEAQAQPAAPRPSPAATWSRPPLAPRRPGAPPPPKELSGADLDLGGGGRPCIVTGAAGFIGFHTAKRLLQLGLRVVGVDNVNSYYDPALKEARLDVLKGYDGFQEARMDLADARHISALFAGAEPALVIHLAAQAGVRHSVENPRAYAEANLSGFLNVLEGCRAVGARHLVYASTSSVYGANRLTPFAEGHGVSHPMSLYAASKIANEAMAHSYAHLFDIPATGLRFFTVYGPWGRPDMALFKFTKAILEGRAIDVYNHGEMRRDFTYIDDIVEGVVRVAAQPPKADEAAAHHTPRPAPDRSAVAPYRVFNIGRGAPVELMRFIDVLQDALGRKAELNFMPMQPGDVPETYCDTTALEHAVGYAPKVSVEEGVEHFVAWYRGFYKV